MQATLVNFFKKILQNKSRFNEVEVRMHLTPKQYTLLKEMYFTKSDTKTDDTVWYFNDSTRAIDSMDGSVLVERKTTTDKQSLLNSPSTFIIASNEDRQEEGQAECYLQAIRDSPLNLKHIKPIQMKVPGKNIQRLPHSGLSPANAADLNLEGIQWVQLPDGRYTNHTAQVPAGSLLLTPDTKTDKTDKTDQTVKRQVYVQEKKLRRRYSNLLSKDVRLELTRSLIVQPTFTKTYSSLEIEICVDSLRRNCQPYIQDLTKRLCSLIQDLISTF